MATYETQFAVRLFTVSNLSYTDVVDPGDKTVLPISFNQLIIYNKSGVMVSLRSNPNNASSQVDIPPADAFTVGAIPWPSNVSTGFRFPTGCPPVCSLLAAGGAPVVVVLELIK